MEIKYPIIIIISIIVFFLILFISFSKFKKRKHRKRVANTFVVKRSVEYKSILRKYRIGMYIIFSLLFFSILSSAFLSSRITKTQVLDGRVYNRDIMLCMDVSGSVNSLNKEIVETYKAIIKSLNGERFGISIFNTSSYLLVPLTDDYDYLLDILNTLSKALSASTDRANYSSSEYLYLVKYLYYGTLVGNASRGSSLIGDGLASCVFDFPNLDEDRSRTIIFSTDNYDQGTSYVNVEEAAKISKNKGIVVYSIATKNTTAKNGLELRKATELTGGQYFIQGQGETIENVVRNIESQEKTALEGDKKSVVIDYPQVPFIIILLGFTALIIVDKEVLS